MPLAVKNNALILKDGKLAESCGCCGGWYCCPSTTQLLQCTSGISVQVSLTASDYQIVKKTSNATCKQSPDDAGVSLSSSSRWLTIGSALSGTHSLPLSSRNGMTSVFTKSLASVGGCPQPSISLTLTAASLTVEIQYTSFASQSVSLSSTADEPPEFQCATKQPGVTGLCKAFTAYGFNTFSSSVYVPLAVCGLGITPIVATTNLTLWQYTWATGVTGDFTPIRGGVTTETQTGSPIVSIGITF
jgi:hypothetical protein